MPMKHMLHRSIVGISVIYRWLFIGGPNVCFFERVYATSHIHFLRSIQSPFFFLNLPSFILLTTPHPNHLNQSKSPTLQSWIASLVYHWYIAGRWLAPSDRRIHEFRIWRRSRRRQRRLQTRIWGLIWVDQLAQAQQSQFMMRRKGSFLWRYIDW